MPRKKHKNYINMDSLVRLHDDIEPFISQALLDEMTRLFNQGYKLTKIAEEFNRDPDEIFYILFHQARRGKINRNIGFRTE